MVTSSGEVLEGKEMLREALQDMIECLPCEGGRETRHCIEGDGIALFINIWSRPDEDEGGERGSEPDASASGAPGLMVARRQPDGGWLIALDAPHGTV